MKVIVDGTEMEARENESLGEFFDRVGIKIKDGYIVSVKRKIDVESISTNLYEVQTSRGKMILRWECDEELKRWKQDYKSFEGCSVRWATIDAVVFGPTKTDFVPSKEEVELRRYEITVSLSGFSNENTHLVFGKRVHSALYFPPKGCGVLGRVVYGRHLLDTLKTGDKIINIAPVLEKKFDPRSLVRAGRDYKLSEGDRIFTKMKIVLDPQSPVCVEHVYNTLTEGFAATRKTSRFIAHDKTKLISIKSERLGVRDRGVVSVRNSGNNAGSVYIYLQKAGISKDHTVVGHVVEGVELADVAGKGDLIEVVLSPDRLDLLGRSQGEVAKVLERYGIKHIREGYAEDNGIVVEHRPATTLEIYKEGQVRCVGLPEDQILKVQLDEGSAPNSVRYFRRVTGLDLRRVGKLDLFFSTKEVILFKGDESLGRSVMPENTPKGIVRSGEIGVTNSVKKFAGMVGIRLEESEKFGPTAESFDGTNLVGRVLENMGVLTGLREGKRVFMMEGDR